MDADLKRFEEELERLSPESLPEGLITRMEAAMEGWEDTVGRDGGKVVPFPKRGDGARSKGGRRSSIWAAAAGVAILGAAAGLFFSSGDPKERTVANRGLPERGEFAEVEFSPQSAKRQIVSSSNENVIIPNGAQPVRLVRLNYIDTVKFRNEEGEEVHVQRPSVGYFFIPVATD